MTKKLVKHRFTEARIQEMIASDPDNPELTDEQISQRKSFAEVFPELADSIKRSRGRPRIESPKQAVTLRINQETLKRFKARGEDWRAEMSRALDASGRRRKA